MATSSCIMLNTTTEDAIVPFAQCYTKLELELAGEAGVNFDTRRSRYSEVTAFSYCNAWGELRTCTCVGFSNPSWLPACQRLELAAGSLKSCPGMPCHDTVCFRGAYQKFVSNVVGSTTSRSREDQGCIWYCRVDAAANTRCFLSSWDTPGAER